MPIEIRELIIKVTVEPSANKRLNQNHSQLLKSEIVHECVEKVMRQLKLKSQR